jgi:Uncharacterised protein conserved in bacteria (DUF2336)
MRPNYVEARHIAWAGSETERTALAAAIPIAPEILYYLAGDQAPSVRRAVAANTATPPVVDHRLARDESPEVRALLGRKLAALAPSLRCEEHDRLCRRSWEALCDLVEDSAVMVRAAIADALKEMPDAPRELILRLAHDTEMPVAEPVIRFSPLLTEADLLALVAQPPVAETVMAVARRPCLSESISDAIIASADAATVAVLLENESAAIRESSLDALVANAARHGAWQERLVRRPSLPARLVKALGEIVADHLLGLLAARPDLDPAVGEALRAKVAARLEDGALPLAEAEGSEARFRAAAERSDRAAMTAALAAATELPEGAVSRAVTLRSAKGLVSLCWRAGYDLETAQLAQAVLGQIAPQARLLPGPDGRWPLAPDEMSWQLELLASM